MLHSETDHIRALLDEAAGAAQAAAQAADNATGHASTAIAQADNARTLATTARARAADAGALIEAAAAALNDLNPGDPEPEPGERPVRPGPNATEAQVIFWAQQLDDWIDTAVGPRGDLTPIGVGQHPGPDGGATGVGSGWNGNRLNVWPAADGGTVRLEGLDIDGLVYVAAETRHLELAGVRCRGLQFANNPNCTVSIDHCDIGDSPDGVALGQGAINMWGQTGWEIHRTRLGGFADGIQCVGTGLLHECLIENLRYDVQTHNDTVQNYGGGVRLAGCVLRGRPPSDYHLNGVFQSTATAMNTLTECVAYVRGPHRFRNWAGHSNPSKNTHATRWFGCYIEGILIGNHARDAGTVHRGPALTEQQAAELAKADTRRKIGLPAGPPLPDDMMWDEAW